jgi:hypothetical protein
MKKMVALTMAAHLTLFAFSQTGSVGIGTTTPNSSAVLDIQSTDKGMLVPRMTTAQRTAISSPSTGLLVYDNTTRSFWWAKGGTLGWVELVDTSNNEWKKRNNNLYLTGANNVSIGVDDPILNSKLSVNGDINLFNGDDVFGSLRHWGGGDLRLNAKMGNTIAGISPADLLLQIPQSSSFPAGNVGIGTATPVAKLDVSGDIRTSGKVMRPSTGAANLVPIAYGRVNFTGFVESGSGNFTVTHDYTGMYTIDIEGVAAVDLVIHGTILVTPMQGGSLYGLNAVAIPSGSPDFQDFFVNIKDHNGYIDSKFSFVVFLPGN